MENLTAGNVKKAMGAAGAVSADLWQVPPDKLKVLPGFNVRTMGPKYEERVEWITNSILANGYYKSEPLAGFVAREGDDDIIYVTGGHHRLDAIGRAIARGAELPVVPVVVSPKGTSLEALTVALMVGNNGNPLSAYECAIVCQRLAAFNWDSAKIAEKLGYASAQHVDNLLSLAAAPVGVRQLVITEAVSATVAIAAIAKHGDKALEVLAASLAKASGGKVTAKHLPGAAFKKALKKHAPTMHSTLKTAFVHPDLPGDLRDAIGAILEALNVK